MVMTATDRSPNYALGSLVSMREMDLTRWGTYEVKVFVDGPTLGFLSDPSVHMSLNQIPAKAERAPFDDVEERIFWNTTRALGSVDRTRPALLCQDDVAFTRGWKQKLDGLVATAQEKHGGGFALALWCGYPWQSENGLAPYIPRKFYGNVAVLFMPDVLEDLVPVLQSQMLDDLHHPDDIAVSQFFDSRPWLTLLAAIPSLVQHVGWCSSHGNEGARTSPTFEP